MNSYTLYPTPAPTPWGMYDRQMEGLHLDGIFFFMLFFWSWILFIFAWSWNHKPRRKAHKPLLPKEHWEAPERWN
jgi:hypothetical protein